MTGRYQAYDEYQPSGVDWLQKVPKHWELTRIGKWFSERRETVSDKDYVPLSVTMQGIVPQLETAAKSDAGDNRKKVKLGDFVINSRSDRKGSSGVADSDGSVSLISIVLEPKDIESRFVHHLMRSQPFQEEFYRFGKGIVADLWSTKYSDMKNIRLALPSREEQKTIARFLDHETARIDELIAKQERLIELLKEKRQAVISHAVTKGLNPRAPMKGSEVEWLGDVPEHWRVAQLRYESKFIGGGTPSKENEEFWCGDIPWVSPKDMKVDYIDTAKDKITLAAVAASSVKLLNAGHVLVVVRGMILLHSFPVALTTSCVTVNQDMKAISPSERLNPEYLMYLLKGLRDAVLDLVDSSAHGTRVLRTELFERLEIPIPPVAEQLEIIQKIKVLIGSMDEASVRASRVVALLKERCAALISAAVTGKIDIRNWTRDNAA